MPTIRGTLFLNAKSGPRLPGRQSEALVEAAREGGLEVVPFTRELDVTAVVRDELRRGRTLFVAAGGDGTVNSVMQGLVQHPEACLGVIPTGTYNHFARDLGIPLDWREALDVALSGARRTVDTARVNDRFFVNNVSIGLYAELVARREEKGRDYPRWKARLLAAYATFRKYPHVTLAIETAHHQELVRTHVFMVSNNSYELSRIGIEASRTLLREGRLSVYWLPHLSRRRLMRFMARYLAGRVRETPGFRSFRTSGMKVQSSRPSLKAGVDGEVLALATPVTITIVPQSLEVMVPHSESGLR
ncbi:MAG TPA: diacylglycerol kinase family protein [Thermoanaerobaculia bacterium]|nr:diacylglycerol kinase family protein [Thermoanaerobaculia bacterium]